MTKRRTSKIRTSYARSMTTVALDSAIDVPARRLRATTLATSPARSGRMLLKKYPTRVDVTTGPVGGLVSLAKRYRHRIALRSTATASIASAGKSHR